MRLRCPHCMKTVTFNDEEARGIFIVCKECKKRFRMNETTPITQGGEPEAAMTPSHTGGRRGIFGRKAADMRVVARHNAKGAELFRRGKYKEAERELRKSLDLNPEQPRVMRMLDEIEKALLTM